MSSIREQAARWFTRVLNLPADHPEREHLRAWLQADSRHASEYQAFCDLWGDFSSTRTTQALARVLEQRNSRRSFVRNGLLGLVGLMALGTAWRFKGSSDFEQRYSTGIGERSRQRLPDGSELYLGADTQLLVRFEQGLRQVYLLRGAAIFDVARDRARPFQVEAGLARVSVLGTRFVVDRAQQALRVSVEHGTVRVDGEHGALVLGAGQVADVGPNGQPVLSVLQASNAFAFERGRLVLERASLEQVASSLSRYRQQPVQVLPGKTTPLINAVIQLDNIEGFLTALPSIAPIEVSQADGSTWLRAR